MDRFLFPVRNPQSNLCVLICSNPSKIIRYDWKKIISLEAAQSSEFLRINWFICLKQSPALQQTNQAGSLAVLFLSPPACCDAESLLTETRCPGIPLGAMLSKLSDYSPTDFTMAVAADRNKCSFPFLLFSLSLSFSFFRKWQHGPSFWASQG